MLGISILARVYWIGTGYWKRLDSMTSRLKRVYPRRKSIRRVEMSRTIGGGTQADKNRGKS